VSELEAALETLRALPKDQRRAPTLLVNPLFRRAVELATPDGLEGDALAAAVWLEALAGRPPDLALAAPLVPRLDDWRGLRGVFLLRALDRHVADFTTLLPGPLATLMLADAGAEVVKIERPGGEEGRRFLPHVNGMSAPFVVLNRGKQGLIADLKTEDGKAKAMALVERADVLVEQFRPGVMERLGFGYETLKTKNPRLIYCSITGYGQTGPRRDEAGHDINYIGATGLLSLSPGPGNRPTVPPALIADIGGGTFPAVINILLALIAREKTGKGSYIDIAMSDAMFTFSWLALAARWAAGKPVDPAMLRHFGGSPRYQMANIGDAARLFSCEAIE